VNERRRCEGYQIRLSLKGSLVTVVMLGTVLENATVYGEKSGSKESEGNFQMQPLARASKGKERHYRPIPLRTENVGVDILEDKLFGNLAPARKIKLTFGRQVVNPNACSCLSTKS